MPMFEAYVNGMPHGRVEGDNAVEVATKLARSQLHLLTHVSEALVYVNTKDVLNGKSRRIGIRINVATKIMEDYSV